MTPKGRVSPFGHRRIKACSRLPDAFRSVPRPSSPLGAKASTRCPSLLENLPSGLGPRSTAPPPRQTGDRRVSAKTVRPNPPANRPGDHVPATPRRRPARTASFQTLPRPAAAGPARPRRRTGNGRAPVLPLHHVQQHRTARPQAAARVRIFPERDPRRLRCASDFRLTMLRIVRHLRRDRRKWWRRTGSNR